MLQRNCKIAMRLPPISKKKEKSSVILVTLEDFFVSIEVQEEVRSTLGASLFWNSVSNIESYNTNQIPMILLHICIHLLAARINFGTYLKLRKYPSLEKINNSSEGI